MMPFFSVGRSRRTYDPRRRCRPFKARRVSPRPASQVHGVVVAQGDHLHPRIPQDRRAQVGAAHQHMALVPLGEAFRPVREHALQVSDGDVVILQHSLYVREAVACVWFRQTMKGFIAVAPQGVLHDFLGPGIAPQQHVADCGDGEDLPLVHHPHPAAYPLSVGAGYHGSGSFGHPGNPGHSGGFVHLHFDHIGIERPGDGLVRGVGGVEGHRKAFEAFPHIQHQGVSVQAQGFGRHRPDGHPAAGNQAGKFVRSPDNGVAGF